MFEYKHYLKPVEFIQYFIIKSRNFIINLAFDANILNKPPETQRIGSAAR